jgi:hypothetical protein
MPHAERMRERLRETRLATPGSENGGGHSVGNAYLTTLCRLETGEQTDEQQERCDNNRPFHGRPLVSGRPGRHLYAALSL